MRHALIRVAAAGAVAVAAALPAHAAGTVQVNYLQPENFSDVGFGSFERDRSLDKLTDVFKKLAERLPDGQVLKLDVSQVDLAGRLQPTHRGQDLRVMTGRADWPQIKLRYTLLAGDTVLKSGDARLTDLNYLQNARLGDNQRSELPYEKRMIDTWFDKTFVAH